MKLELCNRLAIGPALELLGAERFDSFDARRMLLVIALQESRLMYRHQIGGPARGFWQFEEGGGVRGVLTHHATRVSAVALCKRLDVTPTAAAVHTALAYQDVLAAGFARLLLWTLPVALAHTDTDGWAQYMDAWRPGRPHPDTWPRLWRQATAYLVREKETS